MRAITRSFLKLHQEFRLNAYILRAEPFKQARNICQTTAGTTGNWCLQEKQRHNAEFKLKAASGRQQQVRQYAQPTTNLAVAECWNCGKAAACSREMICESCGRLQDVNTKLNYFQLLNLPNNFTVETQELTKRFRQLQTLVHPDKFSNKNTREQNNSADWSALINKAYKTLLVPMERALYMLELNGLHIPEDNSSLNKEFLMEMMERNEQVEEANSKADLERLFAQTADELADKVKALSALFDSNKLEEAKTLLVQMKYILSIQNSIKNKLERFMGS